MDPTSARAYIGTKIVLAWPEFKDGHSGYAVKYEDGYTSWSPAATFQRAYRLVTAEEKGLLG